MQSPLKMCVTENAEIDGYACIYVETYLQCKQKLYKQLMHIYTLRLSCHMNLVKCRKRCTIYNGD